MSWQMSDQMAKQMPWKMPLRWNQKPYFIDIFFEYSLFWNVNIHFFLYYEKYNDACVCVFVFKLFVFLFCLLFMFDYIPAVINNKAKLAIFAIRIFGVFN